MSLKQYNLKIPINPLLKIPINPLLPTIHISLSRWLAAICSTTQGITFKSQQPINNKTSRNVMKYDHFNVRSLTVLCLFQWSYSCTCVGCHANRGVGIKRCPHPGCHWVNMGWNNHSAISHFWHERISLKLRHHYYHIWTGLLWYQIRSFYVRHTNELTIPQHANREHTASKRKKSQRNYILS